MAKTTPMRRCANSACGNRYAPVMFVGKGRLEVPCDWRRYYSARCAGAARNERLWRRKLGVPLKPLGG